MSTTSSMDKNISMVDLSNFQVDFHSDPKNELALNAVTRSDVLDILADRQETTVPHKFSDTVSIQGKATNQKSSGRCWLFAAMNVIRIQMMKDLKLDKDFELSQSYLFFFDKLEKANYFLENVIATRDEDVHSRLFMWLLSAPLNDGGQIDMVYNLVEKYGIVPKSVFPESKASSSSRTMNRILTAKLREFAKDLRANPEASVEELRVLKQEQLNTIFRILCIFLGEPPVTFNWQYYNKDGDYHEDKDLTPVKFFEKYGKWNPDDQLCLINAPTEDKPFEKTFTVKMLNNVIEGRPVRYLNMEVEFLKQCAINQIKDDKPVWFGCDVGKCFMRTMGMMSTALLNYELVFGTDLSMSKAERLDYGESLMTHAMVLTGVDLDEEGKAIKWRVENSWGDEKGDKGYMIMSDEWFSNFVYEVVVEKQYADVSDDVVSADPIVLEPWDPMGALAASVEDEHLEFFEQEQE